MLSLFSSRRNWDSPNPSPVGECAPLLPPGSGGRGTLAGERAKDSSGAWSKRLESFVILMITDQGNMEGYAGFNEDSIYYVTIVQLINHV